MEVGKGMKCSRMMLHFCTKECFSTDAQYNVFGLRVYDCWSSFAEYFGLMSAMINVRDRASYPLYRGITGTIADQTRVNFTLSALRFRLTMPDLPSHRSLLFAPSPLSAKKILQHDLNDSERSPPPPSLVSPAFTPPSTPGSSTPLLQKEPKCVAVDTSLERPPKLLDTLPQVECIVRARIPTVTGAEMFLHLYQNSVDGKEHLAIVFGDNIRSKSRGAYTGRLHPGRTTSRMDPASPSPEPAEDEPRSAPLVRIHSECYTGETAWSARCDCGEQLDEAARLMSLPSSNGGVIIYLRQEGRGIGLGEKLKAYNLQDLGSDTVEANLLLRHPADARSYGMATAMLMDLGLDGEKGIRLLTNNPDKVRAVEGPNREVVVKERVAMVPLAWKTGGKRGIHSDEIEGYLRTKVGFCSRRSGFES